LTDQKKGLDCENWGRHKESKKKDQQRNPKKCNPKSRNWQKFKIKVTNYQRDSGKGGDLGKKDAVREREAGGFKRKKKKPGVPQHLEGKKEFRNGPKRERGELKRE